MTRDDSEERRKRVDKELQELLAEKLFAAEARGEGPIPTKHKKL